MCHNRNFSPALENVARPDCLCISAYMQEMIDMLQCVSHQATCGVFIVVLLSGKLGCAIFSSPIQTRHCSMDAQVVHLKDAFPGAF